MPAAEDEQIAGADEIAESGVSEGAARVAEAGVEVLDVGRIVKRLLVEVPALAHVPGTGAEGKPIARERDVVDVEREVVVGRRAVGRERCHALCLNDFAGRGRPHEQVPAGHVEDVAAVGSKVLDGPGRDELVSRDGGGGARLHWPVAQAGGRSGPDERADQSASSARRGEDRKSTRLNSSHGSISYAVFCLKKKKKYKQQVVTTKKNTTT